ncbi:gluconate 2-dehydrogenase subunit 3 family protein [Radiobacillus sp. PE A8.2]|uniref:gluconate 2-dehydrogenase subunit 3 family protein n=1 Tax=Radiobacillus sp. PE A8.2 TaxID=3380349 RepID=UPI00388E9300
MKKDAEKLFFNDHQWNTIAAAMARIIPSDETPGAEEAGCIVFIDRYLSGTDYIYAKPDGSGFIELKGKELEAYKKRIGMLQKKYIYGIQTLDRLSNASFKEVFCNLSEEKQDEILRQMEKIGQSKELSPQQVLPEEDYDFFSLLVIHTRHGFYSDPVYGGNKDHIGWKLIGFPGPKSLKEAHSGNYTTLPYFASNTEN